TQRVLRVILLQCVLRVSSHDLTHNAPKAWPISLPERDRATLRIQLICCFSYTFCLHTMQSITSSILSRRNRSSTLDPFSQWPFSPEQLYSRDLTGKVFRTKEFPFVRGGNADVFCAKFFEHGGEDG